MLLNPTKQRQLLQAFDGTRLMMEGFGVIGETLQDPREPKRSWTIQNLFQPLPRCLGGIRARCVDQKGFVSFIDQMSLEVLLGIGTPGDDCVWADRNYPSTADRDWFGFCADYDDLLDDLHLRELLLRNDQPILRAGIELAIPVHLDCDNDAIDTYVLLWDGDRTTGQSPDPRQSTVQCRWAHADREKIRWPRI